MLAWLSANLVNIVVVALVLLLLVLAVAKMMSDKKKGICDCGGNCMSCGHHCGGTVQEKKS